MCKTLVWYIPFITSVNKTIFLLSKKEDKENLYLFPLSWEISNSVSSGALGISNFLTEKFMHS